MSDRINIDEFREQIKPIRKEYVEKYNELDAIRDQFNDLVNRIELKNKHPDSVEMDIEDERYAEAEDAHYTEASEVSDIVSDLAYDFNLEWSGSFEEGINDFWTPSTC